MKPKYNPTHGSKIITAAILDVYDNADFADKQKLDKLTKPLMKRCGGISKKGALEILGKVGIFECGKVVKWLAENRIKSYSGIKR